MTGDNGNGCWPRVFQVKYTAGPVFSRQKEHNARNFMLAIPMDPTVEPPTNDDSSVTNQLKWKKRNTQKLQHVGDHEEDTDVLQKPKDPPQPEPLLDPLRHENSAEEACDEEPVPKQSQKTSIPRSAEIAKLKAQQRLGESDSPS